MSNGAISIHVTPEDKDFFYETFYQKKGNGEMKSQGELFHKFVEAFKQVDQGKMKLTQATISEFYSEIEKVVQHLESGNKCDLEKAIENIGNCVGVDLDGKFHSAKSLITDEQYDEYRQRAYGVFEEIDEQSDVDPLDIVDDFLQSMGFILSPNEYPQLGADVLKIAEIKKTA